jgi:hypothetical protein
VFASWEYLTREEKQRVLAVFGLQFRIRKYHITAVTLPLRALLLASSGYFVTQSAMHENIATGDGVAACARQGETLHSGTRRGIASTGAIVAGGHASAHFPSPGEAAGPRTRMDRQRGCSPRPTGRIGIRRARHLRSWKPRQEDKNPRPIGPQPSGGCNPPDPAVTNPLDLLTFFLPSRNRM